MTRRFELWLFILQRGSALVLAPLVLAHLVTIVVAIRGGLSADEILSRTQGSVGWMLFYGAFVVAAAVHAPIGVRTVLREMTAWRGRSLDISAILFALVLLWLGFCAVGAVT